MIHRMADTEYPNLKDALAVARTELELAAAKFDAASAYDNTRKHARAYDIAATELKAAAAKLKRARALIEATIEGRP